MAFNDQQSSTDAEHLKLLVWGYIITGVIAACFSLLGLVYALMAAFMGVVFSHSATGKGSMLVPVLAVSVFAGVGIGIFILMLALASARFWTAHCISQRKSKTFCFVVAAITCMEIPLGTAVGIFSLIVLNRPSVAQMFDRPASRP